MIPAKDPYSTFKEGHGTWLCFLNFHEIRRAPKDKIHIHIFGWIQTTSIVRVNKSRLLA